MRREERFLGAALLGMTNGENSAGGEDETERDGRLIKRLGKLGRSMPPPLIRQRFFE
jgi:hypothetical protein